MNKRKWKKKCIVLRRVSTSKQKKGTSLRIQMQWAKKKADELDAEIIDDSISVGMSGEIFLKTYREQILEIIRQEKIDYVLVYKIDRFTRNLSQGTDVMDKIIELGCSIVTPSEIIDSSSDRLLPNMKMVISEYNRNSIVKGGKEGIISLLKEGKYPFKYIPVGVKVIKNKNSKEYRKASFNSSFKNLIIDIFSTFMNTCNYTKTTTEINGRYKNILDESLSVDQVKKALTNPIYIGYISFDGKRYGKDGSSEIPNPLLRVIDEELFDKAQKIVEEIRKKRRKNNKTPLRDALSNHIETYGFDMVINNLDGMLKVCCKKCGSLDLEKNGPEVINGHFMQKYTCNDGGYQFRFPSSKQLKRLQNLDPRRCMYCGSADAFIVTKSVLSDHYQVRCNKCGYTVLVPSSDSKFQRLCK